MEENINLLIVANADASAGLKAALGRDDVTLLEAHSGTEARVILDEQAPALAVLDLDMREAEPLARACMAAPRRGMPLLLLAAADAAVRLPEGHEASAVELLRKPVESGALAARVEGLLRLERQRQLARMQAQQKTNEMFMTVLGHDLRTPLSAMMASSELLLFLSRDEKARAASTRIKSSAARMTRMVDQLVNLARLQSGRVTLDRQPLDMGDLCEYMATEARTRHAERTLQVRREGDVAAEGDESLLARVIATLLCNALQHGDPVEPVILELDGRDPSCLRISVSNAGGIPAEAQAQLFEATLGKARGAHEPEGLGLGLHVAREFARLHGGDISVHSTQEEGTRFVFELPRPQAGDSALPA